MAGGGGGDDDDWTVDLFIATAVAQTSWLVFPVQQEGAGLVLARQIDQGKTSEAVGDKMSPTRPRVPRQQTAPFPIVVLLVGIQILRNSTELPGLLFQIKDAQTEFLTQQDSQFGNGAIEDFFQ